MFKSLFPSPESKGAHDFTALDRLMPHQVYGRNLWVCVLNPSCSTFFTVKPLLAEVYDLAVSKHTKRQADDPRRSDREE